MSDIAPVSGMGGGRSEAAGPATDRPGIRGSRARDYSRPPRPSDRVDLSARARLLGKMAELPALRVELVEQVRREIAANTYESEERLDGALNALRDDLDTFA